MRNILFFNTFRTKDKQGCGRYHLTRPHLRSFIKCKKGEILIVQKAEKTLGIVAVLTISPRAGCLWYIWDDALRPQRWRKKKNPASS